MQWNKLGDGPRRKDGSLVVTQHDPRDGCCNYCGRPFSDHGSIYPSWFVVCPGDHIVEKMGEFWPVKAVCGTDGGRS